jgi:hypothetical protein
MEYLCYNALPTPVVSVLAQSSSSKNLAWQYCLSLVARRHLLACLTAHIIAVLNFQILLSTVHSTHLVNAYGGEDPSGRQRTAGRHGASTPVQLLKPSLERLLYQKQDTHSQCTLQHYIHVSSSSKDKQLSLNKDLITGRLMSSGIASHSL